MTIFVVNKNTKNKIVHNDQNESRSLKKEKYNITLQNMVII